MTDSTIKTIREIRGRTDYKQVALENRLLRSILGDLIELTENWYYGPLFNNCQVYGDSEPLPMLRAKAFLCGDRRRAAWVKAGVLATMEIKRWLRAAPHKLIHAVTGVWIFAVGILATKLGQDTGWWEPAATVPVMLAAFGGYMAGGAVMFGRMVYRRFGTKI